MEAGVEPHLFVVLGATGDLSRKKLIPALYHLLEEKNLKERCHVLGVARSEVEEEKFRDIARRSLEDAGFPAAEVEKWCGSWTHFQSIGESGGDYASLKERIESLEKEMDLPGNRVYYLALPPKAFAGAIEHLGESALNRSPGWTRIVVEKPFGWDLESAQELSGLIHRFFHEDQIYRIDHYLGKQTVQNLMIFRFANTIFESLWNRDHIESVEITVAENLGIGNRGKYYDPSGALRDIVQNHLMQLLSLVGMEAPSVFTARSIRDEKVKVLQSVTEIKPRHAVLGQYGKGEIDSEKVPGYRQEKDVPEDSRTETYAAIRLNIDNWRWQNVPFYLRTGKRLSQRLTQVAVRFRKPPIWLFKPAGRSPLHSNLIVIRLQPDEGFHLSFDVKKPEEELNLVTENLHFHYKEAFGPIPEAYQTLLLDIMKGDQTLFVRADEVEASWSICTPLLEADLPVHPYEAGTWGPPEADDLARPYGGWLPIDS